MHDNQQAYIDGSIINKERNVGIKSFMGLYAPHHLCDEGEWKCRICLKN